MYAFEDGDVSARRGSLQDDTVCAGSAPHGCAGSASGYRG
jgi:hypothetical protein